MKHYTKFDISSSFISSVDKYRKKTYNNSVCCFDIETTSYKIAADIKQSLCYIWQFSVEGDVVYGRTLEEFRLLLEELKHGVEGTIIIYVHNLGFELQHLFNIIPDFEVFARTARKPIYAYSKSLDVEFRCSLMLYQKSLAKLSKETTVKKLVGDLDYSIIRTPYTPLTATELGYCENDVLVIDEMIHKEIKTYGTVARIPLTQTGKVRKHVKELFDKDYSYHARMKRMQPDTVEEFNFMLKCYQGGYTHANASYVDQIMQNVDSFDFASSYPYVMVAFKFPGKFTKYTLNSLDDMKPSRAYLLHLKFTDITCETQNTYIQFAKVKAKEPVVDNGRVVSADELYIYCTELDYDIIKQTYSWESVEIIESYAAYKSYLPKKYVEYILELYEYKTTLKNIKGKEDIYTESKQFINSLYGCFCTNNIRPEISVNECLWQRTELTPEMIQDKLNEAKTSWNTILYYAWGIYTCAYARHNLWCGGIIPNDDYVLYTDTDSIKVLHGKADRAVESYNQSVLKRLEHVSRIRHIPLNKFMPVDTEGNKRPLGVFDFEGTYDRFITQGAKKYAYEQNGELHITLAGVNKNVGAQTLQKLENFREGFYFEPGKAGKLTLTYNDEQIPAIVTGIDGVPFEAHYKYGVYMEPAGYKLGMSFEFATYLESIHTIYKEGFIYE